MNAMTYLNALIKKSQQDQGNNIYTQLCEMIVVSADLTTEQITALTQIFEKNPYHKLLFAALKKANAITLLGEKFSTAFDRVSAAKSKEEAQAIIEEINKVEEFAAETFSAKGSDGTYTHALQDNGNVFRGDVDEYIRKTVIGNITFHCTFNGLSNDDETEMSIYEEWLKTGEYSEMREYLLVNHREFRS